MMNQVLVMALGLTLAVSASAEADVAKVAIVDMNKALQTVDAGKKAKAALERESADRTKKLQAEEAAIRKAGEEFRKQSLVMSEDARNKKQAELQERVVKFQEAIQKSQVEFREKEQTATIPIVGQLKAIISELAKEKGYSVVLVKDDNTVLYSLDKDDMTSDVISAYDKKHKSK